jgi:putative transposase
LIARISSGASFRGSRIASRCRRRRPSNPSDAHASPRSSSVGLRAAWANPDPAQARAELEALARGLARKRPGAAASLREGLAETLTVNRLGVGGELLQTVEPISPVESMIETVRDHAGRMKRWSSGEMALRWAAAGMLAAQAQFRRVKGYQELPALVAALGHATADEPGLGDLAATA